jgi:hypothetical protein
MEERGLMEEDEIFRWTTGLVKLLEEKKDISTKFMMQLSRVMEPEGDLNIGLIRERILSAKEWFSTFLTTLKNDIDETVKKFSTNKIAKKHLPSFRQLLLSVSIKEKQMQQSLHIVDAMYNGEQRDEILKISEQRIIPDSIPGFAYTSPLKQKDSKDKTPSALISLHLFQEGKSIEEIAIARNLALSTIESHLVSFIETGEIKIEELVSEEKIPFIIEAIGTLDGHAMKPVKDQLGDEYSYGEIRAVLAHLKSSLPTEN